VRADSPPEMNVRRPAMDGRHRIPAAVIFPGFSADSWRERNVSRRYAGVSRQRSGKNCAHTSRALFSALYRSLCSHSYEFRWTSRGNRRLKTVINPSPRHDKNETRRCSADVELLPPFSSKFIVARDVRVSYAVRGRIRAPFVCESLERKAST